MEIDDFIATRNKALIEMDFDYARNMMGPKASNELIELTLHKARYECKDIPAECRHTSAAWLRQHGYGRLTGEPLLPEGELPV